MANFLSKLFGARSPEGRPVKVHFTGPDGDRIAEMTVGLDIPVDLYKEAADQETGDIYGLEYYEEGVQKKQIVPKYIWEKARAAHQAIDDGAADAIQRLNDTLSKLK